MKSSRLQIRVSIGSYVEALRNLGHDVVWKPPIFEDNPRDYDLIICGIVPTGKIVTIYLFPAAYLLGRAKRAGTPVILADDDWQTSIRQTQMQSANYAFRPFRLLENDFLYGRLGSDWVRAEGNQEARDLVLEGLAAVAQDEYPWIRCTWPWAPHEPYQEDTKMAVWLFDPSSYVTYPPEMVGVDASVKKRRWIVSALADHSRFLSDLGTDWPIDFYTSARKNLAYPSDKLVKLKKIPQDQLLVEQGRVAGGIVTHYKKKPGWWRHQMETLPRVKSVVWLPKWDAGNLSSENFGWNIHHLERMGNDALRELATAQQAEVESWVWDKQRLQTELSMMLRDVMEGRITA